MTSRWRDERGSAAVEITLVAPVLVLFILVVIFGGRLALARQAVESAAFDAARAASLARTQTDARTAAAKTAAATLTNQKLPCTSTQLDLDTTGFDKPVGTPATITVHLVCDVATGDLGLPGIASTVLVDAEATSPLDAYRERR